MQKNILALTLAGRILVAGLIAVLVLGAAVQPTHADNTAAEVSSRLGAIQKASLVAADAESLDEFGWAVSISGNTAIVGARNEDPDLGQGPLSNAGAAYIFVRSGTTWIQEAKLVPRDAKPGDAFGVSVAIDGNIAVVGATGADLEDADNAGAAYIFVREGITWKQKAKLVASDPFKDDSFGTAVAIDRDTIVVAADSKDIEFLIDAGAAYVFVFRGTSWDQKSKLMPPDPTVGGYFGSSVAVEGSRVVVGATEAHPEGVLGPGAAYVYKGRGNTWALEARLASEDSRPGDFFGHSVAISGERIVIGAIFKDPDLGVGRVTNAGAAYIFSRQGDDWEQQARLVPEQASPFTEFGQSVSITGDRVVVSAAEAEQGGYTGAGAAYLFIRSDKEWVQQTKIIADYIYEDDSFGESVGISGDWVIVGASGRDPGGRSRAGEAFMYQLAQVQLPETGFPPGRITRLAAQPPARAYAELGDLWLDIPRLAVQAPIVAVSQGGSGWDTTWLGEQAGFLEGTAFPTWEGNTGIAGHRYLSNGAPGPFVNLDQLTWGEKIYIHAWGQRYAYEIREVSQVRPDDLSVLKHETYDWVTLITCDDFDEELQKYTGRTVVRAVLTSITDE
jgi:LPXTG-site transpeptidase (sortase) family protein